MPAPKPRIVYFDHMQHPAGRERLETAPEVELVRLERDAAPETVWPVLGTALGYQIASSRQELPRHLHADAAFLARCPQLLVVSTDGAGADTVDLAACTQAGVAVVNQAGGNAEAVAEHALGMMLSLTKRIGEADRALRRDRAWRRTDFWGRELKGRTLGIVGLGHTGSRIAELCGGALGMRVIACDPYIAAERFARFGARAVTFGELLADADVVSVSCPLNAETRGMFDRSAFARMREGALFITTARGGIHDEAALADALRGGHIGGAGVDVWVEEPPPLDHPLLAFPNVVVTPHIAGVTEESRRQTSLICAEQWLGIWRGERPPRLLNPEAWPAYAARFAERFGAAVEA
jgi:D-3-phosphoglycerate dehydrogenase